MADSRHIVQSSKGPKGQTCQSKPRNDQEITKALIHNGKNKSEHMFGALATDRYAFNCSPSPIFG